MSDKIKVINIYGLRGISDLELELDGKSLILKGENGTGKSSIVDAIEFFFTGEISHLKGTQGLSILRHGPHINCDHDDVNIEITFKDNTKLSRTFYTPPSPPDYLRNYFEITQKRKFILHRSEILKFITSQPADRYRAIGSIIGIESLDDIELKIKRLLKDYEIKMESEEEKINNLFKEISGIIGKRIEKEQDILPALNEKIKQYDFSSISSFSEIKEYIEEQYKTKLIKKKILNDRIYFKDIIEIVKIPFIPEKMVEDLKAINDGVKVLLDKNVKLKINLLSFLEKGRDIIDQEDINICPLCEQEIKKEELLKNVELRLKTLTSLTDEAFNLRTKIGRVLIEFKAKIHQLNSVEALFNQYDGLNTIKEKLRNNISFLKNFSEQIYNLENFQTEVSISELLQQRDKIDDLLKNILLECDKKLKGIELTSEEKKILEILDLIRKVDDKRISLLKTMDNFDKYKKYYELSEKIFSSFSEAKKAKIQEIYDSLVADIQKFYSIIHPDDTHKNIRVFIDPNRRASTQLTVEAFNREGEDPRALISEGHLDTLGLCIFLAFVRKFNTGCTLIILDDVVTTVDGKHRNHIARLLLDEFTENQFIITTHDGIWYEQLCAYQRACGLENNFKNMTILNWDLTIGPKIIPYKPRWEKIIDLINNNNKSSGGNEGRTYLEWILKEICENMEAFIPYKKNGNNQLSELFDSAKKRMRVLLNRLSDDNSFKKKVLKAFHELKILYFLGNILSHDNPDFENLSIEEVKGFCDAVHNLHITFSCPNCHSLVDYDHNKNIIMCSNKKKCKNPLLEIIR